MMSGVSINKFKYLHMQAAELHAAMSSCTALKVGAVAVKNNRIICTGYNGTLPGTDNCCEDLVNIDGVLTTITKDSVIHAEDNLIRFANDNNIDLTNTDIYITHSPCENCAKLIHGAKFANVYYSRAYKRTTGIDYLLSKNIGVFAI